MARLFKRRRVDHSLSKRLPYQPRDLLSAGERRFYDALAEATAGRWGISLKTRLADLVGCPADEWSSPHGRRLAQKHIDFVLYDLADVSVLLVIELDDRSHERAERRQRDRFVDTVLHFVGITVLRVRASHSYSAQTIRRYLERVLIRRVIH